MQQLESTSRASLRPADFAPAFKEMLLDRAELVRPEITRQLVSTWAEEHRILPASMTPRPGPFRWDVAPYMKEIADCFAEASPVRKVVLMKGAQITFTVGVLENVIGYVIDSAPGPMMFVSGDKGAAEASVELRVDHMIQSAGLANKIFSQAEKPHSKKTGDTKAKKEFAGGFLLACGPRVGAKLRVFAIRYLLLDEIDAYPQQVGENVSKEGDPITVAEKRTVAFERTRKILYGGTPLVKQTSRIEPLFLRGDQRYYFVPCKRCGAMQPLRWRDSEGKYRLKYEVDEAGHLVSESVHYECEACGEAWRNEDKAWFLPRGEWRATAVSMEPALRSYHISALYSPIGMRSWESICQEWIGVGDDVAKLRAFLNLTLGETFEERGWAPSPARIRSRNSEDYRSGELPPMARPLLLTAGIDVQDDRIAAEVVAWGRDMESWSLEYVEIPGDTSDLTSEAWKGLQALLLTKHAGYELHAALIDEGGHRTEEARLFCEDFGPSVRPVKGEAWARRGGGVFTRRDIHGHDRQAILLNVDALKERLFTLLSKGTADGAPPREPFAGYCHFPASYTEAYYRQLCSEERVHDRGRDGRQVVRWRKIHTRNEALDCRVYAMGALYVAFDDWQRTVSQEDETEQAHGWGEFWTVGEREREQQERGAKARK